MTGTPDMSQTRQRNPRGRGERLHGELVEAAVRVLAAHGDTERLSIGAGATTERPVAIAGLGTVGVTAAYVDHLASAATPALAGTGWVSASSKPIRRWTRTSQAGAHQFQRPSRAIRDGTSSARTMNASMRTATAVPTPTSLRKTSLEVANAPRATASRTDAKVISRPVRCIPVAIACRSGTPG